MTRRAVLLIVALSSGLYALSIYVVWMLWYSSLQFAALVPTFGVDMSVRSSDQPSILGTALVVAAVSGLIACLLGYVLAPDMRRDWPSIAVGVLAGPAAVCGLFTVTRLAVQLTPSLAAVFIVALAPASLAALVASFIVMLVPSVCAVGLVAIRIHGMYGVDSPQVRKNGVDSV